MPDRGRTTSCKTCAGVIEATPAGFWTCGSCGRTLPELSSKDHAEDAVTSEGLSPVRVDSTLLERTAEPWRCWCGAEECDDRRHRACGFAACTGHRVWGTE